MKIVFVACFLALCLDFVSSDIQHPVIFVPGDAGSRLYTTLDTPPRNVTPCDTAGPWNVPFVAWVNIVDILSFLECVVSQLTLNYNRTTHRTSDPDYVKVETMDFGSTKTIDYLGTDFGPHFSLLEYFHKMTQYMVEYGGYVRNKSLRGAPYDFRRAPNELEEFYKNLTQLIETTYEVNGNKRVVTVAHSMGNSVMLYLYNHMSQHWKDKYIKAHVALAAPWAGAVSAIKAISSGYIMGTSTLISPLQVRPIERSMPSTTWLMPSPRVWGPQEVLVRTAHRNYTVNDYEAFFRDLDFLDGSYMRNDTQHLIEDLKPPRVEIHCLYGYGVETPGMLDYPEGAFPDQQPHVIMDDGDGTVNLRSLKGCLQWASQQEQPVRHMAYYNLTHLGMVKDEIVMAYILDVLES